MRALPEHSVMSEEDLKAPPPLLSGGASPHGLDGFNETKLEEHDTESQQSVFAQASLSQATFSGGPQLQAGSATFSQARSRVIRCW